MTDTKKIIAQNIRKYRIKAGLSQVALGKLLGVHSSSISNWEKEQNSIDIDTLFKFCDLLNVPIGDMVKEEPSEHDVDYVVNIERKPHLNMLIEVAKKMPDKEIKRLYEYFKYFSEHEKSTD